MFHNYASLQLWTLEDKRRGKWRFLLTRNWLRNYSMLKILMILREGEKKEKLRPTPRDLWIVRAITTENAVDRFIANDWSTNRSVHTRGVRERRSSIRISNGTRCSMRVRKTAWPSCSIVSDINKYKYCSRIPQVFFSATFLRGYHVDFSFSYH